MKSTSVANAQKVLSDEKPVAHFPTLSMSTKPSTPSTPTFSFVKKDVAVVSQQSILPVISNAGSSLQKTDVLQTNSAQQKPASTPFVFSGFTSAATSFGKLTPAVQTNNDNSSAKTESINNIIQPVSENSSITISKVDETSKQSPSNTLSMPGNVQQNSRLDSKNVENSPSTVSTTDTITVKTSELKSQPKSADEVQADTKLKSLIFTLASSEETEKNNPPECNVSVTVVGVETEKAPVLEKADQKTVTPPITPVKGKI